MGLKIDEVLSVTGLASFLKEVGLVALFVFAEGEQKAIWADGIEKKKSVESFKLP